MKKGRVLNDLREKTFNLSAKPASSCTIKGGRRVRIIHGMSTRKYYDSSSGLNHIRGYRMDKIVSLTQLAIRFYNIKEHTNFGQVKVLKVVRSLSGAIDNYITFEAFSHPGVASVFIAEVTEFLDAYERIEIRSVKIKHSDSNHNGKNSQEGIPQKQTLSHDSLNDVAPYISQYALAMYNIFTLHVKKDAVHDISSVKVIRAIIHDAPSLKVVKGKKHEAEGTTYLVTFEASLRDERKNVETFETKISVPTLFPTLIIQFKEIQIKHD
ncbi:hypothetical protein OROMI_028319 [Orobanche minor]